MTFRVHGPFVVALLITASASAQAGPTVTESVFASGAGLGATGPDSVSYANGSLWVEYINGADSTGASGSSLIVQYSAKGAAWNAWSIAGSVDGLKFNPVTGMVGRCRTRTAIPRCR